MDNRYSKLKAKKITGQLLLMCLLLVFFDQPAFASQATASVFNRSPRQQKPLISVNFKKEPLTNVLHDLARRVNVGISYETQIVPPKRVTYKANKVTVYQVLDDVLQGTRLYATLSDNHKVILIKKKGIQKEVLQSTITGTVTDASNGKTLPGVNILVEGTTIGTSTDNNGHYELKVPSSQDTLRFSFIGYQKQSVPIKGRDKIDVALTPKALTGKELVVVGYGKQKKNDVTGSISSVESDDIQDRSVQQVGQALQGKVAGVQITQNSGKPGASLLVRVRGAGTVNNSDPLYVIDGNPVANPYDLSPDQIKSIQVLKSASASAIYGARGANGVVLITTKGGKSGKPSFQVKYQEGIQQVAKKMNLANAKQYAELYNETLKNSGQQAKFSNVNSLGKGTNWQDAIFQSAPTRKFSASFSGGNETSTYYISGNYYKQKGIIRGSDYDRLSIRINSDHNVNSYLKIGEHLAASYATRNDLPNAYDNVANVIIHTLQMDPTAPVKYSNGDFGAPKYSDANNPIAQVYYNNDQTRRPVLQGDVYLEINPIQNLTYHSQFNLDYGFLKRSQFTPTFDVFPKQRNGVTSVSRTDSQWKNWTWQNTFTYENNFGPNNVKILAGITAQSNNSEYLYATGQGVPPNANTDANLRYLDLATSGQQVAGNGGSFGMVSYLGRVNYDYKDTYLATVNFRVDGSSKFGKNNRFGYFPSFSLGWRLSNEAFLEDVDFINELKIRGGWGELGNQNSLSNYAFANTVTNNINYVFGKNQSVSVGQAPTGKGNPNLKWETTKETDLGLDFKGFQNRITFSADYYYKKTSDMLLQVPIVNYSGIQQPPFKNGGDVVNKGLEFSLGYQKTSPGGFYYNISANVAHNVNEVTKLSNSGAAIFSGGYQSLGNLSKTAVGHPIASFYGYEMEGIFQNQSQVNNHAKQAKGTAPGDIMFKDLNHDGVINQDDMTYIGNPWPDYTYGLNANFAWKNFDLDMSFQGSYGNDIFAAWKYYTEGSNYYNFDTNMLNAWNGEGSTNKIPRLITSDPNNNARESTYYVENGSYFRLKNIQLGYTLPSSVSQRLGLEKVRVYVAGQNLFTITPYDGFNPEIGTPGSNKPLDVGIDRGIYPLSRIFMSGLDIKI